MLRLRLGVCRPPARRLRGVPSTTVADLDRRREDPKPRIAAAGESWSHQRSLSGLSTGILFETETVNADAGDAG